MKSTKKTREASASIIKERIQNDSSLTKEELASFHHVLDCLSDLQEYVEILREINRLVGINKVYKHQLPGRSAAICSVVSDAVNNVSCRNIE